MYQVCIQKKQCRDLCPKEATGIVLLGFDISGCGAEMEALGSFRSACGQILGDFDCDHH
jgi:hypothetical protein